VSTLLSTLHNTDRKRVGSLNWFSAQLQDLACAAARCPTLDLHISVYVTCLCDPEAVPDIPNSLVTMERPAALGMLRRFISPGAGRGEGASEGTGASADTVEVGPVKRAGGQGRVNVLGGEGEEVTEVEMPVMAGGEARVEGGVAVCAAGPESLTREVANAVARVGMLSGARVGGIALHTEAYAI
jgi:ferric-chelate reductase